MNDLIINSHLAIPSTELEITASRSSGPGGQHVNTSDTRIQVRWPLRDSPALSEDQRRRLEGRLRARLTANGELIVACDTHRSQRRNRVEALQRLAALVRESLIAPRVRKKTRPTAASRRKRLEDKRHRSRRKQARRRPHNED